MGFNSGFKGLILALCLTIPCSKLCCRLPFLTGSVEVFFPKFRQIQRLSLKAGQGRVFTSHLYTNKLDNVVGFLLGNSPASEFYMPMFRNTVSVPSS